MLLPFLIFKIQMIVSKKVILKACVAMIQLFSVKLHPLSLKCTV